MWIFVAYIIVTILGQLSISVDAERAFCPPTHFVLNQNRTIQVEGYRTALIFEIHGSLFVSKSDDPVYWSEYPSGAVVSRNIYNHVGILGIDKIYINAFYNQSLYPTPPTVEDIYPASKSCVSDWNNLGVIDWRPRVYGGPIETWPLNAAGKPSLDKNLYKSIRGSNLIFDEIRNKTDYIFLLDIDEFLVPVNFNVSDAHHKWCRKMHPPIISKILEQMLFTATTSKLENYMQLKNSSRDGDVLSSHAACMMGYSYCWWRQSCVGIESIYMPSYVWMKEQKTSVGMVPTVRSRFPADYSWRMHTEDTDCYAQYWKSVFVSKFNPPMRTKAIHDNPEAKFRILAPRSYHGRLSLELAHIRRVNHWRNKTSEQQYLVTDSKLTYLYNLYRRCSKSE